MANTSSSRADTALVNGAPKETNSNVELEDIRGATPKLPIEEDIMQLARLGEVGAIQKLFDSGKFDATYRDEQGITPLHWAAINNHYALCHYLIGAGAPINAKGGDANATPVLWAAKRCNYYIVNLLLQRGADPLLTDGEGFNLLHSATLDGNVFQLTLLLHQDIPVDIPDSQGHTSLMWAAYKGYPACVDVLLAWGASVEARDDLGFTALHWALVRGSLHAVQKLVEYGADRFAKNNEGKTPAVTAKDMNNVRLWHLALSQAGYNPDGSSKAFPLPWVKDKRWFLNRFFFIWPSFILLVAMSIISHMTIFIALPLALGVAFGLQTLAQQTLRWAPPDINSLHKTPFLAGVFAGSLFWVWVRWPTKILPWTMHSNPLLNLVFGGFIVTCTYFYFMAMTADPGFVPRSGSRNKQKGVIDELLELRKFDEHNFCVTCMVRRPLRSKHCKRCRRCVAKHDHHCPWVNNCVAINNHRQFALYVLTMEVGVLTLVYLTMRYLEQLPTPDPEPTCNIISSSLCTILNKDPFTIVLVAWNALQLVWVTMLLIVQLMQIARAQTTFESMRGHLHNKGPADTLTNFAVTGAATPADAQITAANRGPDPVQPPHARRKEGCFEQWKRLLGVDVFLNTAIHGSNAETVMRRQRQNPFTRGMMTNCKEFWCDGTSVVGYRTESGMARLGGERVDYTRMYEAPAHMLYRGESSGSGGRYEAVGSGGTDDNV